MYVRQPPQLIYLFLYQAEVYLHTAYSVSSHATPLAPLRADSIASRFHVNKYPTLKLLRNGQPAKGEFRGQRSAEAFLAFLEEELRDPVKVITSTEDIKQVSGWHVRGGYIQCIVGWLFRLNSFRAGTTNGVCQGKCIQNVHGHDPKPVNCHLQCILCCPVH